MKRKFITALIVLLATVGSLFAEQSTPFVLTDFPISLIVPDTAIWIKWAGINVDTDTTGPDSAIIYYSETPGGSIIENYTDSITVYVADSTLNIISANNISFLGSPDQRGTEFSPSDNGMGAGIYYLVVANKTTILGSDTVFVSNEVQLIVEATTAVEAVSPKGGDTISELTPNFMWSNNPGVPYYHIIVSDEKISPDLDNNSVEGLSIIWEAITSNTQITYGASDPSGTLTAVAPPFSPGTEYSWVVLNNYGNHPAYSSTRFSLPASFVVEGEPLIAPKSIFPANDTTLTSLANGTINLSWTDLDTNANTYMVYIYVTSEISTGVTAQTVVWSTEVTAGQFTGDTAFVTMNAASILTNNSYSWKVIAVDSKGAGTSGNLSLFKYSTPTGTIVVKTRENINSGGDIVEKNVGLVELKLEVLDGSTDAPLLYYTDANGYFSRTRQAGSYRLTTIKDGYESQSKTITLADAAAETITFYLERPDATIFGKVVDNSGIAVNLAIVTAISERGDTVIAETDPSGSYVLSCYAADWSVSANKDSYSASSTIDTTLITGNSVDLKSNLIITKNPFNLYGTVKNSSGEALLGVSVKLLKSGTVIGEISSTPQSGEYSFSVESGTYTLIADKTGFSSYSSEVIVVNSMQQAITLDAGASLLSGSVIGKSYNKNGVLVYAPITNATVLIIDTSTVPNDTVSATSDNVYGLYSKSLVGGGKYFKIISSAGGYITGESYTASAIENGKTYNILDTITAFASMSGLIKYSSAINGVSVSLVNLSTFDIVASATGDASGEFEVRNIPNSNSEIFKISAGATGYVVDSVVVVDKDGNSITTDSIKVTNGQVLLSQNNKPVDSILIYMESGDKYLGWCVYSGATVLSGSSVKVKSPILTTILGSDTLSGVGPNEYIISVDAVSDSIMDCAFHKYTLAAGADTVHIDSVSLPVSHISNDTLVLSNGALSLSLTSLSAIDSGYIYYRDVAAQTYSVDTVSLDSLSGGVNYYSTNVSMSKDGIEMVYYFVLYIGADRYGYEQEVFRSYVKPDAKIISLLSIFPSVSDTFTFAADDDISFTVNGYYGSKYAKVDTLPQSNIVWSFRSTAYGASIASTGGSVTINTGKSGSGDSVVILDATFISGSDYKLGANVDSVASVVFQISPYKLDSVIIVRTDNTGRDYITTSPSERAEFSAVGFDEQGNEVDVTPVWRLTPVTAGTIDEGVLRSSNNYFGRVDINADVGSKDVYYFQNSLRGFPINYLIPSVKDTATNGLGVLQNGEGCNIYFPDGLVSLGSQKMLGLTVENDSNVIYLITKIDKDSTNTAKLTGKFDLIGSKYDIEDKSGVFANSTDTMTLTIGVPLQYQEKVRSGEKFYIALWNDSLKEWTPNENTVASADGASLSVGVTHFSTYGILASPQSTDANFSIYPNPFSPLVKPKARDGNDAQFGTCLTVNAISKNNAFLDIDLEIYNMIGQRVWSTVIKDAVSNKTYKVWWDGKTLSDSKLLGLRNQVGSAANGIYRIDGEKMCRNGRYFAVLTIEDNDEKKQYMKNIILFK